jgi:ELWxxDGT repeat protein
VALVDLLDETLLYVLCADGATLVFSLNSQGPPQLLKNCPADAQFWQPGDPLDLLSGELPATIPAIALAMSVHPPDHPAWELPAVLDNQLYFPLYTNELGRELWTSDGTIEGTTLVIDAYPGLPSSSPHSLVSLNGVLYFLAEHPRDGKIVWYSEGGPETTAPLDAGATSAHFLVIEGESIAPLGSNLVIAMRNPLFGEQENMELGIIHLQPNGNEYQPIKGFPGGHKGWIRDLAVSDDRIFYTAPDEESRLRLWMCPAPEMKPVMVTVDE